MTEDPLREVTDAGHITAALRRSGVLGDARVRNVTVESSGCVGGASMVTA